jgi:hypothetical protein
MIEEAGIKLEEDKASAGAGGAGTLKIVPYVVGAFRSGQCRKRTSGGFMMGHSRGRTCSVSTLQAWSATTFSSVMTFDFGKHEDLVEVGVARKPENRKRPVNLECFAMAQLQRMVDSRRQSRDASALRLLPSTARGARLAACYRP